MELRIKSPFPIIWKAIYDHDVDSLIIPYCKKCDSYVKATKEVETTCPKCNEKSIIYNDTNKIELINNTLFEFTDQGETINFKLIPTYKLKYFGAINLIDKKQYVLDISNGNIIYTDQNNSLFVTEPAVCINDSVIKIRDVPDLDIADNLIHYKKAIAEINGPNILTNIVIGYKVKINDNDVSVILDFDCRRKELMPSIYYKL